VKNVYKLTGILLATIGGFGLLYLGYGPLAIILWLISLRAYLILHPEARAIYESEAATAAWRKQHA
jgi:hypothetical protein